MLETTKTHPVQDGTGWAQGVEPPKWPYLNIFERIWLVRWNGYLTGRRNTFGVFCFVDIFGASNLGAGLVGARESVCPLRPHLGLDITVIA